MDEDKVVVVKDSSGGSWVLGIVLLVVFIIGAIIALPYLRSDAAKDNAIGQAAQEVGNAANEVGQAARDYTEKN